MSVRREKKRKYYRGSRTYGWGRVAQHRRSGRKGGRGHAGYMKHKWTWVVKYAPDWFGSKGFKRHPSIVRKYRSINVGELDEIVEKLLAQNLAEKVDDKVKIDLEKLGVQKLLGRGRVTHALIIEAVKATEEAKAKIEAAGGEVIIKGES